MHREADRITRRPQRTECTAESNIERKNEKKKKRQGKSWRKWQRKKKKLNRRR